MKVRIFAASALVAASAAAQLLEPAPELPLGVEAKWRQALAAGEAALREGEWERTARRAQKLLDEIVATIGRGLGSEPLLARATLARALARGGLGQERDAVWDYWQSRALDPTLARTDLAAFGEAGRRLQAQIATEESRIEGAAEACAEGGCPGFVEQTAVVSPALAFPNGGVRRCSAGPLLVQCVVGQDGLLYHPEAPEMREPVLAFLVLESLRLYRYRPATLDGKPIAVRFGIEIETRLPPCPGFR